MTDKPSRANRAPSCERSHSCGCFIVSGGQQAQQRRLVFRPEWEWSVAYFPFRRRVSAAVATILQGSRMSACLCALHTHKQNKRTQHTTTRTLLRITEAGRSVSVEARRICDARRCSTAISLMRRDFLLSTEPAVDKACSPCACLVEPAQASSHHCCIRPVIVHAGRLCSAMTSPLHNSGCAMIHAHT